MYLLHAKKQMHLIRCIWFIEWAVESLAAATHTITCIYTIKIIMYVYNEWQLPLILLHVHTQ